MPLSGAMVTWRLAMLLIVGASSLDSAVFLPRPIIEQPLRPATTMSASSGRSAGALLFGRIFALPREIGPVVQLRDRETRLNGIGGQTLLLARQLGHREVLHDALLLAAQCRDPRDQRLDALVEIGD